MRRKMKTAFEAVLVAVASIIFVVGMSWMFHF